MDCIKLINNLNRATRQYNLSPLAQVIFLRLWEKHNLNRWEDEWVTYPDAALMADTQEKSRSRLYRARRELEAAQLIAHRTDSKRISVYTLTALDLHDSDEERRTSNEPQTNINVTSNEPQTNINRTSNDTRPALEPQGLEGDGRTSNEHQANINETSSEHQRNINETKNQVPSYMQSKRLKIKDNKNIYKEKIYKRESPKKQKPVKHTYGEYGKVLLRDEEFEKLKAEFPDDWEEWIRRVDSYCAMNGKRYTNYLAVIRNWSRKDKENGFNSTAKPKFGAGHARSRPQREYETEEAREQLLAAWDEE